MPNAQTYRDISLAQSYWFGAVQPRIALLQTGFYHQDPESASALKEAIDSELAAIYTAIAAVKSLRNSQTAIRRLPPEVLTRIFLFCSLQELPYCHSGHSKEEASELWQRWNPGWMKVTYVCRFWRDAALQDPRLWGTNIACHLPVRWFKETLDRSKLAPASIRLASRWDSDPLQFNDEVNSLLSKHLHHIRHLALEGGDSCDMSPVIGALTLSRAPVLETLEFEKRVRKGLGILPDEVFARYAPRLRRVQLVNYVLPAAFCPEAISRLEHLDLEISSRDKFGVDFHRSDKCIPYSTLFSTLRQMNALRTLRLKNALPPCAADVFTSHECTSNLPRLEELEVDDGLPEIICLLECLRISATTRIKLRSDHSVGARRPIEGAHVLAAQLRRHLQAAPTPCPALRLWCYTSDHYVSVHVKLWSFIPDKATESDAIVDVDIDDGLIPRSEQTGTDAIGQFCRALGVDAVTWLQCYLAPTERWSYEDLVDLYAAFPALEVLKMCGSTGKHFARFLTSPTGGKKLSVNTAMLQRLRVLILDRFDLGPPPPKSRKAKPGKCEYMYLLEAFRKRMAALGRVPKLVVCSGIMKQEWIEELRQEIGEVEWVQPEDKNNWWNAMAST
ncbi:hypothetical protein EWM64_g9064 [Hericium alpestre]|uniref:Uncharacterized protein n=1 Tax=Hericium alpestre TaxID=135208 RepID=A0A4Y9ZNE8_9AGAM|nr:hypothetical protein EWM64_g9064 [Hericium alpestre]